MNKEFLKFLSKKFKSVLVLAFLRNEFAALERERDRYKDLAIKDSLTGCLNRRGLDLMFEDKRQRLTALMGLDLDGFKAVNDTFGHDIGDEVIVIAAQAIRSACRHEDTVVRPGGDEFVIVLNHDRDSIEQVKQRAHEIRRSVEFRLKDYGVTASIGYTVARTDSDRRSFSSCIKRADVAMYKAKRQGGNRVVFAPSNPKNKPHQAAARNKQEFSLVRECAMEA